MAANPGLGEGGHPAEADGRLVVDIIVGERMDHSHYRSTCTEDGANSLRFDMRVSPEICVGDLVYVRGVRRTVSAVERSPSQQVVSLTPITQLAAND